MSMFCMLYSYLHKILLNALSSKRWPKQYCLSDFNIKCISGHRGEIVEMLWRVVLLDNRRGLSPCKTWLSCSECFKVKKDMSNVVFQIALFNLEMCLVKWVYIKKQFTYAVYGKNWIFCLSFFSIAEGDVILVIILGVFYFSFSLLLSAIS